MERSILLVFVVAIVAIGLLAGVADRWTPRNYVAQPGECFVPPQGDPLYDEHYAKNVNQPNCDAFKVQSEAKYIDAQTDQTRTETGIGLFGVYATLFVFAGVVIFLALATKKGNE